MERHQFVGGVAEPLKLFVQQPLADSEVCGRGGFERAVLPAIGRVNATLAKPADNKRVRFLSINDSSPKPCSRQTPPIDRGLPGLGRLLEAIFTDLLGPRSADDLAPPPTGDPSAQR